MEQNLKKYFSRSPEVAAVYLFGSRARGRHREDSDVDIGVLLRAPDAVPAELMRERMVVELSRKLRKDIHVVIMNSASEVLLKQILSHGRQILVKDKQLLSRFLMTATA
ncbi:MAG: nucleotidyltransferase domain-containing protein, partial [Pseudomonadota bacterium]